MMTSFYSPFSFLYCPSLPYVQCRSGFLSSSVNYPTLTSSGTNYPSCFELIARGRLKIEDAHPSIRTHDLRMNQQPTTLVSANSANQLPLFGHFCCRLAVQHTTKFDTFSGLLRIEKYQWNGLSERSQNHSYYKKGGSFTNSMTRRLSVRKFQGRRVWASLEGFSLKMWLLDDDDVVVNHQTSFNKRQIPRTSVSSCYSSSSTSSGNSSCSPHPNHSNLPSPPPFISTAVLSRDADVVIAISESTVAEERREKRNSSSPSSFLILIDRRKEGEQSSQLIGTGEGDDEEQIFVMSSSSSTSSSSMISGSNRSTTIADYTTDDETHATSNSRTCTTTSMTTTYEADEEDAIHQWVTQLSDRIEEYKRWKPILDRQRGEGGTGEAPMQVLIPTPNPASSPAAIPTAMNGVNKNSSSLFDPSNFSSYSSRNTTSPFILPSSTLKRGEKGRKELSVPRSVTGTLYSQTPCPLSLDDEDDFDYEKGRNKEHDTHSQQQKATSENYQPEKERGRTHAAEVFSRSRLDHYSIKKKSSLTKGSEGHSSISREDNEPTYQCWLWIPYAFVLSTTFLR